MSRIFVPSASAEDWRPLLAAPERHWRTGFSAKALAHCWQAAQGFPVEIAQVLAASGVGALQRAELLFAFPEYKVALPGGGAASQTDLFAVGKAADGQLLAMAVEGKVGESFDRTVARWLLDASIGKQRRLAFIQQCLGLPSASIGHIRYQLLHRTAAAVLEAERLNAGHAILLVHSFSQSDRWFDDFEAFTALFGQQIQPNQLVLLRQSPRLAIYAAWVRGNPAFLSS